MSADNRFVLGDYNAACYECGRKKKASELKAHWRGYWVCPEHWEPRHPQDFVGGVPNTTQVPWAQPQTDVFVPSGIPDFPPFDPNNP